MPEFRKDPFTNRHVIIAIERSKRPKDFTLDDYSEVRIDKHSENCFFCLGNESSTPPETFRIESGNHWVVRSFPNKYPILLPDSSINKESESLFELSNGIGLHEVIVEHYEHDKNFFNMTKKEFKDTIIAYKNRYNAFYRDKNTMYISIFKNYLKKAGASLAHPHSQIISVPIIPNNILIEIEQCNRFYEEKGRVLHEVIIAEEQSKKKRLIYETDNFAVISPFASMYNYETEIIFKYMGLFNNITDQLIDELSEVFYRLFQKYNEVLGSFPFNLFLHSHPKSYEDAKYHWHFHMTPRMSNQAGFELSTGVYVNDVSPEDAAKTLFIDKIQELKLTDL